ncbi:MAG TPA: hypothetical protein VGV37_13375 [Aliidongia sp.]|uniref:hypothetical protein n=1 Tax=Aliidongia sp. TaxID=1914230 RepID=UPI002DDD7303|nr:hypothetical protein [Aliidongia sp.]HEV2675529.1 hypothetical protein [Aliidongia sp.]
MTDPIQIHAEALPEMLANIARWTSVEIAIAIAREFGGGRLYIPETIKREHPLARLVGLQAARVIGAQLGGERFKVPSARVYLNWLDAKRMFAEGKTRQQIAKTLHLNYDRVRQLTAGFEMLDRDAVLSMIPLRQPASCPGCGRRRCSPKAHQPAKAPVDAKQLSLFPPDAA